MVNKPDMIMFVCLCVVCMCVCLCVCSHNDVAAPRHFLFAIPWVSLIQAKPQPLPQRDKTDHLFWRELWVIIAKENRFRSPQITSFNEVAIS